jgi:hypothetical protein
MVGESGIELSIFYKFKVRYGMLQTSYPMFTETSFLKANVART